ncbi:MAG: DUF4040 domain-containing protein [Planctomycetes bacterium]|nr:DUF4040 domain-containing protein [Planctomycetota bacterium]
MSDRWLVELLLAVVVVTAVGVVRARNLLVASVLMGAYSLVMALIWTAMQAYDVALTEAAVGAGISTILLIGALIRVGSRIGGSKERDAPRVDKVALAVALLTGAALAYGTLDMPAIGDRAAPVHVHPKVARHYIDRSMEETGVPNMVTVVLASYRGYDTMFETCVVFTAALGVMVLLRRRRDAAQPLPEPTPGEMRDQAIFTVMTRMTAPFVLVYGSYVITHGELGPGGGFQGGVILAAAYLIYALVHGLAAAQRALPPRVTDLGAGAGVLIYAGVGVVCLLLGGDFLAYDALNQADPVKGQQLGMTLVELGVGLTVACVMVTIFNEVARP